jgi:hypothetical protein
MFYVSLVKGKITIKPDKGTKRAFDRKEHEAIGDFLAKAVSKGDESLGDFMTSSSVNHPGEYGFPKNFDISEVMNKAVQHAYRKLAVVIEPPALDDAAEIIEDAVRGWKLGFPMPILFRRARSPQGDGKPEDVLLPFPSEESLDLFLSGLKYAKRLAKLDRDRDGG